MRNDRICWIDSRTIKRGRVLVLDGALVPFCSKYLDACMRANDVLKRLKKGTKLSADCLSADSPLLVRDGPPHTLKMYQRDCWSLVGSIFIGRTVRPRWADGPPL